MAIYIYYGKIGDGKSYHVVATEILPAVRDGRKMYVYLDGLNPRRLSQFSGCNAKIELWDNAEQVREACRLAVDDRDGAGLKLERGALVVVDEAQMVWDSREWQKTGKESLAFFEYHRHFGLDVVLITQSPGRLDKGLVRLANECLHVKNLRFLSGVLGGRYVVNVRQTPQDREPLATIRGKFESNVFACYRSATQVRGAKVHGRGFRGVMILGPAALAAALFLYVRSDGIGTFKGRAATVSLNTGTVPSESAWPKPGPELRRLDPPVGVGDGAGRLPVEAASAAKPDDALTVKKDDKGKVVGVVDVDGVVVQTWRQGDRVLSGVGGS